MPELRRDPIINRWVIIARERARRPITAPSEAPKKPSGFCPLCPGNEEKTSIPVYTDWIPGLNGESTHWRLRVVLNKFPALVHEGVLEPENNGLYERMDGVGAHEVVIETPDHSVSLADFDNRQAFSLLDAYQKRMDELGRDSRFRYILVFKNHGTDAGASLDHPHSQIIALPIVPKRVLEEMRGADAYFQKNQRCVFCDIVRFERDARSRVVLENADFIAIEPFAARFPYETWILPKRHETHFESLDRGRLEGLAVLFRDTMQRIKNLLNDPPYNFMLHTSPCNDSDSLLSYHWHLEITPKLTRVAGFEWGTGFFINPMPPEMAAELLRGEGGNGVSPDPPSPSPKQ